MADDTFAFVDSETWAADCLEFRSSVLTGVYRHYCGDFDGLPVDETTGEFEFCHCWDSPEAQKYAQDRAAIDRGG